MKSNLKKIFILIALILSLTNLSYAAEPEKAEKKAPQDSMTQADMVRHISGMLDSMQEIMSYVPGLKKEGEGKETFYSYNGIRLDKLAKEDLDKLRSRVQNEATRIRADRINKQMAQIKRIQQFNQNNARINRISYQPALPPRTPKTYNMPVTPPRVPQTYRPPQVPSPSTKK